ncbi:AraC family transcriptional regulator [Actinacidiphila glaucinigra]|uniref:AraC family transcriptional regulator n=1 Tax=Actinacidiphila glaucinigra TaxID=235986 RepID=UPI0033F229D3
MNQPQAAGSLPRGSGASRRGQLDGGRDRRRWGFVSPAHFSRSFRAAYGLSPGEWRRTASDRSPRRHAAGGRARRVLAAAVLPPRPILGRDTPLRP